ncbi:MAG: hypothetical protein IT210_02150 [Armatimonadetes bacterium]|nr:hypothetical protein [Armatimonadota bacterium]
MRYVIGLEGGGTKVISALADEEGRILGTGRGGPVSSLDNSLEEIEASVKTALAGILTGRDGLRPHIAAVVTATLGDRRAVAGAVRSYLGDVPVHPRAEIDICFKAALMDEPGLALLGGTGSWAHARDRAGRTGHCGGWGPLLGDEGSGYYIAWHALKAICRSEDGMLPPTALTRRILDHLGIGDMSRLVLKAYDGSMPRPVIGSLCPLVFQAASEGDEVAVLTLEKAGREYGRSACGVIRKMGWESERFPVSGIGGVFRGDAPLGIVRRTAMAHIHRIAPEAFWSFARLEPVGGAALEALRVIGVSLEKHVIHNLEAGNNSSRED